MSLARAADVTRWPGWALFLTMAAAGAALAWLSFDLLRVAMANRDFIAEHGWMGLMDGGLAQAGVVVAQAALALLAYLVFKLAEVELLARWRRPRG